MPTGECVVSKSPRTDVIHCGAQELAHGRLGYLRQPLSINKLTVTKSGSPSNLLSLEGAVATAGQHSADGGLLNATIYSHDIARGIEVSASVYNLLDQGIGPSGGTEHVRDLIEQDGRTFRIKVTYRF